MAFSCLLAELRQEAASKLLIRSKIHEQKSLYKPIGIQRKDKLSIRVYALSQRYSN